jgi:hypothetical protein
MHPAWREWNEGNQGVWVLSGTQVNFPQIKMATSGACNLTATAKSGVTWLRCLTLGLPKHEG